MKNDGLLIAPNFVDPKSYLQSGNKTKITPSIQVVSNSITGYSDRMIVKNILVWMNKNTKRIDNEKDSRKFKRSANEILESKERTGCCDSSTIFTALARSKNIPTMQIITFNKIWAKNILKKENNIIPSGHYFTACYLTDVNGNSDWFLIDTDQKVYDPRDVKYSKLNKTSRHIDKNFYSFAYVKDYSDICINGLNIDSIENMAKIQFEALKHCDISDLYHNESEHEHNNR